jgi:V/A-type H+/Na+-transporting ATPase subunit G/H
MSNIQDQEDYISTLKQIKEVETRVQLELDNHKKMIDEKISDLESDLKNSVTAAIENGKKLVETSFSQARETASKEAEMIISEADLKSKKLSFKPSPDIMKDLIQVLFSGIWK